MIDSDWTMVASCACQQPDEAEVRRALLLLFSPDDLHELRALPSGRATFIHAGDVDAAIEAAKDAGRGLYYTLNPIGNQPEKGTTDKDIAYRRWFLIDIDPVKPDDHKDDSSTEAEKDHVRTVAAKVTEDLWSRQWPTPVVIDSGNGIHLLYWIWLPNDILSKQWIAGCLKALARLHDTKHATIDTSVHNASRIAKLPGTWARKGADTEERPHRVCRILSAPQVIEQVTDEQLRALAENAKTETPVKPYRLEDSWEMVVKTGSRNALDSYVQTALAQEVSRVALTAKLRNNTLNDAAFRLATLIGAEVLDREDTWARLEQAALATGLPIREIQATLRSAFTAGIAKPRKLPESLRKQTARVKLLAPDSTLVVQASTVKPKMVEWLMPNRIPYGFITLFAGRTGLGKSFVTCDLAARLTQGDPWPESGGLRAIAGNVLFISEDPFEYVLTPRLLEMGADLKRVFYLSWEAMAQYHLSDTGMLDRAFSQAGSPTLVVIDPPTNFLGGKDEHKNSEVRQTLMTLVAWLNGRKTACILITHVSKSSGKGHEAINRVIGSVAWATTSRIAHAFNPDPDNPGRSLFLPMKSNLGPMPRGLAYRIVQTETLARIEWLGEVDTTADEASNHEPQGKREKRSDKAVEFLTERFAAQVEWPCGELYKEAEKLGISRKALWEGKEALNLTAKKRGHQWFWQMLAGEGTYVNGTGNGKVPF